MVEWRDERPETAQTDDKPAGKGEEPATQVAPATPGPAPDVPESSEGAAIAPDAPDAVDTAALEEQVIAAISTVFDPEIPVNIYELGLIYDIVIDPAANVAIEMTLTSPACPVAGSLPGDVEGVVRGVSGIADAKVDLVWDPPWTPDRMTEAARLELGMM
jgi:FeS assembly SUF system protein